MKSVISFSLQALLVIAAVVLFSFFDPFNIMGTKKKMLADTPIEVQSITEIGKYISAEYYGEVLASLPEVEINQYDKESTKNEVQNLHERFKMAMKDIKDKTSWPWKQTKLLKLFRKNYEREIIEDPQFSTYMQFLIKRFNNEDEADLIYKFSQDAKMLDNIKVDNLAEGLKEFKKNDLAVNGIATDKQLIMLGRGWVKAGFDFGKFTARNFRYDKEHRAIYLVGVQPQILSCTINPWFIPEDKVKGFEVVYYSGRKVNPEDVRMVKQECLDKLRNAALRNGIIEQARINAKDNLRTFFSLIIPGGIDSVYIYDDSLMVYKNEILEDSVLKGSELVLVDSMLMNANAGKLNLDSAKAFMNSLINMRVLLTDTHRVELTPWSMEVYDIIADHAVDAKEYAQLKFWSEDSLLQNSHDRWYSTLLPGIQERKVWFNLALSEIASGVNQMADTLGGTNVIIADTSINSVLNRLRR